MRYTAKLAALWLSWCVLYFGAVAVLNGCAAVQKVSDLHNSACERIGENNRADLEPMVKAKADELGVSLADAWKLWRTSCEARHLGAANAAAGKSGATASDCAEPASVFDP